MQYEHRANTPCGLNAQLVGGPQARKHKLHLRLAQCRLECLFAFDAQCPLLRRMRRGHLHPALSEGVI